MVRARWWAWGNNRDIPHLALLYQANKIGQLGQIQESLGKYLAHIPNHFKLGSREMKHFSFLNCMAISKQQQLREQGK